MSFFSWSYFFIISEFSSKHSNTSSSFYYEEYRFLEGTSLAAEGRVGGRKRWWGMGKGETVLNNIFKNGFIFLKCTDYRDFFSKIVLIVRTFSKIVRIVRISSEIVRICLRIFSKKFWPPCKYQGAKYLPKPAKKYLFSLKTKISIVI